MSAQAQEPPADGSTLTAMTVLLHAWKEGDSSAFSRLAEAVQTDFLRMAAVRLSGSGAVTLSKGDLVNEAWLRLMNSPHAWENRAHFFATVALSMRSVLREHARAKLSDKRGGGQLPLTLNSVELGEDSMAADLLTVDALLDQLHQLDARCAQVLQLTYFTGMQRSDIATVMAISVPTVDRELRFGRAWLAEKLGRELEA